MTKKGPWHWAALTSIGLGVLAMTGCSGTVQERLGLGRRAPDEFQVVRRQPLVVPPEYRLPPPGTTTPPTQQATPSAQTQELLFGTVQREPEQSEAELALLQSVPGEATPGIREQLLVENTELRQLDESRFLFILDFQRQRMADQTGLTTPLDAQAEADRLQAEGASERVVTRRVATTIVEPQ